MLYYGALFNERNPMSKDSVMETGWEKARAEGCDYGMFSLTGNRRVHDFVTKTCDILNAPPNSTSEGTATEIYRAQKFIKAFRYFHRRYLSCILKHGEVSDTAVREAIRSRLEKVDQGYKIAECL